MPAVHQNPSPCPCTTQGIWTQTQACMSDCRRSCHEWGAHARFKQFPVPLTHKPPRRRPPESESLSCGSGASPSPAAGWMQPREEGRTARLQTDTCPVVRYQSEHFNSIMVMMIYKKIKPHSRGGIMWPAVLPAFSSDQYNALKRSVFNNRKATWIPGLAMLAVCCSSLIQTLVF